MMIIPHSWCVSAVPAFWMCENDAPVIDVTSKSLTMSYLTVPQFDAAYWSIIVCGVIPVVFLLIGTVIWFKRRKQ